MHLPPQMDVRGLGVRASTCAAERAASGVGVAAASGGCEVGCGGGGCTTGAASGERSAAAAGCCAAGGKNSHDVVTLGGRSGSEELDASAGIKPCIAPESGLTTKRPRRTPTMRE